MNRRGLFIAALGLSLAGNIASGQDPRYLDRTSGSSVEIETIQPGIAQPLVPGTKVTISVDVRYTLAAESGRVALYIQKPEPPLLAYQTKPLVKGTGKLTLTAEIEVPRTRRIDVNVALYHAERQSTTIVDSRVYEVVRE